MARASPAGSVFRSDTASVRAAGTTIPPAVVMDAIWMSSISLRRASPQWVTPAAETGSAPEPRRCAAGGEKRPAPVGPQAGHPGRHAVEEMDFRARQPRGREVLAGRQIGAEPFQRG